MRIDRCICAMLLGFWLCGVASAAELTPSATEADLDLPNCQLVVDGKVQAASMESLPFALGMRLEPMRVDRQRPWWTTGAVPGSDRHFRVAFTRSIPLGTVISSFTGPILRPLQPMSGQWVSYLKPGAAYPGDVTKDDQWVVLPAGMVKILPPGGVQTRALRFTERILGDTITPRETRMGRTILFQERYYSALAIGHERRTGKEKMPETWLGTWAEPQTVVGLLFFTLRTNPTVELLKTTATRHALVATPEDWRRLPGLPEFGEYRLYPIAHPAPTTAIRLMGGAFSWNSNFPTVLPLVNLGDTLTAPTLEVTAPPFAVKYDMPLNGFVAVDLLEKKTGQRVRRLVGESARERGPVEERWNLKDEAGEYVPPGDYVVRALARPPFQLTWQTSVYNAGQPAWWAPAPGKGGGGWLADHAPPDSAEAMGDTVWLGAQVTESGHAFIAVDKEGNKLWGEHAVSEGFSGPERIATDGRYGYLVNNALVQRVDPKAGFDAKKIFDFHHTLTLPGNGGHWDAFHGGAAARGDKLYVSYWAPAESWFKPSFKAETLDPKRCMPMAFLKKGNGRHDLRDVKNGYGEGEYDELMKLYAAFLTENMPDGTRIPSSTQAVFGDAPTAGDLAGWVIATFKEPVVIGSILVPDGKIKVQALKAGMDLPEATPADDGPDLGDGADEEDGGGLADEKIWVPLPVTARLGRPSVALAPPGGITTKALRFQANRLTYALVMARRFADVAADAERVYLTGEATDRGGWKVSRPASTPINTTNPAMMGLVWPTPTAMRGLSLHLPTTAVLKVDRYTGPATGDPKGALADDAQWQELGEIKPGGSWWRVETPTLQSLDFGETLTLRAVRIRAIYPAGAWYDGIYGAGWTAVADQHQAGFHAVVVWRHLGDDPTNLPVILNERVSEYQLPGEDGAGMKTLRHLPLKRPGHLVFDNAGVLHAVSDRQIVAVPLTGGAPQVVIGRDKLDKPSDLAFDADGLLYVADCGPKVIKVFNVKSGALVRTLGTPGGQKLGKWDPLRFDYPTGLTIDGAGKLWITDHTYQPKRVQRMSRDGAVEKIFLGPTQYGGGGKMDPKDKSVINFNNMKFVIDWKTYDWKLDSLLARPDDPRSVGADNIDRVFYYTPTPAAGTPTPNPLPAGKGAVISAAPAGKEFRYLVDWGYAGSPVAAICREEGGIAVPLAAMGNLGKWSDVERRPELRKKFGVLNTPTFFFVWWDGNGDGQPQADEVQIRPLDKLITERSGVTVGEDLAFIGVGWRLRPSAFTADGRPQFDVAKIEPVPTQSRPGRTERVWGTADGRTFVIGNRLIGADGKTRLWEYYDKWAIHEGFYQSGWGYNRPAGELNQEHSPIGHFTLKTTQGHTEEFFITNSDQGDWFAFTGDGMLAGCLFGGPAGYGLRRWTMPEWEHNKTALIDVRLDQEHYQGCVTTAEDGKVYAVAGHNHASIVRIDGLEEVRRLPLSTLTVTPADIQAAQAWDLQRQTAEKLRQEPKVAKLPYLEGGVEVNGSLDDWPDELLVTIHEEIKRSFHGPPERIIYYRGGLAYDDKNLYIAWMVPERGGQLRNTAADPIRLFKSGDAIDITLGVDPAADPKRLRPVAGDLRILISRLKGEPVVVIYRPVVPGTPSEKAVRFTSPVAETLIDVVTVLNEPDVVLRNGIAEAAIPWKALGVAPPPVGAKIRGDIGVLEADQNGVTTSTRYYWSGKAQTMVCDLAGEARLAPSLWGEFFCTEPDKSMKFGPGDEVEP
jgi:hypothetical protein